MKQWEHEVGDCIDHRSGKMTAVVLCRGRTSGGTEVYAVELTEEDDRPIRVLRAPYIKHVMPGSESCRWCHHHIGGRCTRQR